MKRIVMISAMLMLVMLTGCSNKQKEKILDDYFGDAVVTEGAVDKDAEITGSAVDSDAVVTVNGKNAGELIHHIHTFYNGTICYGSYKNADKKDQLEMAKDIQRYIDELNTSNESLQEDLDTINTIGTEIINGVGDGTESYISLHRMFHDLDIYINGYKKSKPFNVTEYRGK